jgi:hypothetical protein
VTKENLSLNLEMKSICEAFHALEKLWRERLGAEFLYEAFIVNYSFNFPGRNYHFIVVFFSVRRSCSPAFVNQEKRCFVIYAFFAKPSVCRSNFSTIQYFR